MRDSENVVLYADIGFCGLVLIMSAAVGLDMSYRKTRCLRAGYPVLQGNYINGFFCVKRLDQTDVVTEFKNVAP